MNCGSVVGTFDVMSGVSVAGIFDVMYGSSAAGTFAVCGSVATLPPYDSHQFVPSMRDCDGTTACDGTTGPV